MSKKITDLTPAAAALSTMLFEVVYNPGIAGEASQSVTLDQIAQLMFSSAYGLESQQQLLTGSGANPNSPMITPKDQNIGAEYYQDPAITLYNRWAWSISTKTWYQYLA